MPLLDVRCKRHGIREIFVHQTQLGSPTDSAIRCPVCEKPAQRIWSAPALTVIDFRDGWDMGAGRYFNTKRERENWISETGKRRVKD